MKTKKPIIYSRRFVFNRRDVIHYILDTIVYLTPILLSQTEEIKTILIHYGVMPELAGLTVALGGGLLRRFLSEHPIIYETSEQVEDDKSEKGK